MAQAIFLKWSNDHKNEQQEQELNIFVLAIVRLVQVGSRVDGGMKSGRLKTSKWLTMGFTMEKKMKKVWNIYKFSFESGLSSLYSWLILHIHE